MKDPNQKIPLKQLQLLPGVAMPALSGRLGQCITSDMADIWIERFESGEAYVFCRGKQRPGLAASPHPLVMWDVRSTASMTPAGAIS
jgi:hypothetical protein